LCLIARHANGASLRKLAPVQPILVNGRTVTSTYLANGDRVTLGSIDLTVEVAPGAAPPGVVDEERLAELAAGEQQVRDQMEQLETDRVIWYRRREEIEAECRRQTENLQEISLRLRQQDRDVAAARSDLEAREQALRDAQEELTTQRQA